MFKIILIFFLIEKLFSYDQVTFEVYKQSLSITNCKKCIPYRFKFTSDKNMSVSIPCLYDSSGIKIDNNLNTSFAIFESEENNIASFSKHHDLHSVMGYTIDLNDNYYILDQGKIFMDNNTVEKNTSKLVIAKLHDDKNKREIYFGEIDLRNSLLTDIVLSHDEKYAYITDSGNFNSENPTPRLIVVNLNESKIYTILNNHSSFQPDPKFDLTKSKIGNEIYDYFIEAVGVNNIQISCDDETIYYSSLKSGNIYSVSTKDILNAIKNYEDSKNIKDLNDINVNSVNKNFFSENFIITSKNNFFAINPDSNRIDVSYNIKEDLSSYKNDQNINIKYDNNNFRSPFSLEIHENILYLLGNNIGSGDASNDFKIYKAELKKDEFNNNIGCTVFIFKVYGGVIFVFVWFFLILCITIVLIIVNSGQKLEKINLKKEIEKEEDINALNRELNE